jgi:hypothetical protein
MFTYLINCSFDCFSLLIKSFVGLGSYPTNPLISRQNFITRKIQRVEFFSQVPFKAATNSPKAWQKSNFITLHNQYNFIPLSQLPSVRACFYLLRKKFLNLITTSAAEKQRMRKLDNISAFRVFHPSTDYHCCLSAEGGPSTCLVVALAKTEALAETEASAKTEGRSNRAKPRDSRNCRMGKLDDFSSILVCL